MHAVTLTATQHLFDGISLLLRPQIRGGGHHCARSNSEVVRLLPFTTLSMYWAVWDLVCCCGGQTTKAKGPTTCIARAQS